ncbi:MAG: PAS domain-containing protein [Planctomycetaceae bacterium]|nr:PAS domain-containing protein [Planctomycetaceae bacterium]
MDSAKHLANDALDDVSDDLPRRQLEPSPPEERPYVVGIGASAGGLESLERFFKSMPADSGLAFVVIQHLSPDFKSLMDELLARHTRMRIHRVENGMDVDANSIYLIPPKKEMIISGGKLLLTDKDPDQELSLPIDHFFRSLAQDVGSCSVAIVLSGTGSDGSRGIIDIHNAGGLVMAQSEASAKFDGMPKSARDTGVVDHVLSPEEMPAQLVKHLSRAQLNHHCNVAQEAEDAADLEGYDAIFKLLRDEYGIDFSYYKPNTVSRRIERRLSMNQSTDLTEYVDQLRVDLPELNALYKDLLIGVTRFFRDREAYERLERDVLPELIAKAKPEQELRVWVAGCATGEEPYSLAILLYEQLSKLDRPLSVKIFASDVHQSSLEFASAAVYDEEALAKVSPERLNRFFIRRGDRYQVSNELRQLVVFARHNVMKDAPFTKLDLISCRNLLIYFQPPAQRKALSLFHFGLKTRGALFLGPSETLGELSNEFEVLDDHWKIFRKRRDVRLPADMRIPLSTPVGTFRASPTPPAHSGFDASLMSTYDRLLEEFMPAGLLVTDGRQLVHTFGDAGRYLRHRAGRPTTDVLDLLEGDLKMALAGAIQRASKEQTPLIYHGIRATTPNGDEQLTLGVKPLLNRHGNLTHLFVSLESLGAATSRERTASEMDVDEASKEHLNSLETELRYTRENLQATIEELETSNEELQASNEELVASNEELQSTNEELHSVNEELYTVNAEYQKKIVELTEMTDDMDNLLRSTEIGTIFLDRNLCIRKFTPQIGRAFDLLPQDVGRRIDSFSHNIRYPDLIADVGKVLETDVPLEREVQDRSGQWFFLRVLPYRSHSKLDGVVLTLIDVSALKRTEARLQQMSAIVESSEDAIVGMDLEDRITTWNRGAAKLYGYEPSEATGQEIWLLAAQDPSESQSLLRDAHARTIAGKLRDQPVEMQSRRHDGNSMVVLCSFSPIREQQGVVIGVSMIARDISRQKEAESDRERYAEELETINSQLRAEVARRQKAEAEARDAVEKRDQFLAMLSHELRNPLAAVLNSASILQWDHLDKETVDEARGAIARQSKQMARLLDDLLDVSRITRGKIGIRAKTVDLCQTSRDAVEAVQPALEGRDLHLYIELPNHPIPVKGDAARLQQIQVNLLTNAIKYTPPGGEVALLAEQNGAEAVLRVRDTGIGIPAAMHDRIFDLFVQVDDAPGKTETGMGVGLTLVQTLVRLHGGTVEVTSGGIGEGSEFIVRLPIAGEEVASEMSRSDAALSLQGMRVVLVEDREDIRTVTGKLLKAFGCEVTAAENGTKGIAAVASSDPDVALIDIGLPDLSGYDVAQQIRELPNGASVKLLALTGFGQPDDRERALSAGFDEHLVKPLEYQSLLKAISTASTNGAKKP